MRWIWIDRFVEFNPRQSAVAVKNLSWAEDHFADHFPGYPVMPAPLMIEGLAQTGGILVGHANDFKEKVVLAKIPKAIFHREAFPGEQLFYRTEILDLRPEGAVVKGTATVNGFPTQPNAEFELIGEAEIFFAHLDQNRSQQIFGDHNFVFDGELKNILGLSNVSGIGK